jgi:uncharacterized protein (DUF2147 family)
LPDRRWLLKFAAVADGRVNHEGDLSFGERKMRARYLMVAAAVLSLVSTSYAVSPEPSATGLWQSLDDDTHQPNAWFLIRDSGGGVYAGAIVKMFLKPGEDPNVACDRCADDRRNKPWMGLEIIRGMKRDGMKYTDGTILDPRDGNIYSAQMTLTPDGQTLVVRGYLGISLLGKNQYWTRLPDTAFNEIDPRFNPNPPAAATARKPKQDAAKH